MRQATPGSAAAVPRASGSAPPAPPAPTVKPGCTLSKDGTEEICPPQPGDGMRRGKWEAPPWALWVVLVVVVGASTLYLLRRLGVLRIRKADTK